MSEPFSRRSFIPAAFTLVPASALGVGGTAPSEKLNIAGIGVGGMGASYLKNFESENVVALADVDDTFAAKTFARYPKAKVYRDFRRLLEQEKSVDAIVIGTPDHSHAAIATAAIELGKHVYCAKPLTRTIHEARLVAKAAREHKMATQMSVQSCASDAALSTAEWIRARAVGRVREVHFWSDRPLWPQGVARPGDTPPVPAGFDWDLWLGPAPVRPYHPIYHPFNWRGWFDFGSGPIGDMGCHSLHVIVTALRLGHPTAVYAAGGFAQEPVYERRDGRTWAYCQKAERPETFPDSSIVTWDFPARGDLPPVRLTWYDGGLKPPRPAEMDYARPLPPAGILFIGEKGVLMSGFSGGPALVPESRMAAFRPPPKTLPRTIGHYQEFLQAAKGGKPANCNFEFGSLLTEIVLLGAIAIRTGRPLVWDASACRFTNDAEANGYIEEKYRAGWSL